VLHDRYYYAARAAEERTLAIASASLKVRAIHLDMAARYDVRVAAEAERWAAADPTQERLQITVRMRGSADVG
jgi:hypothetical protein